MSAASGCRADAASPGKKRPLALDGRPRPVIFAHRGGAGEWPESTLAAFTGALRADPGLALELDVRRTQDGHLVVIHDGTVDRTTNGSGRVAEMTLTAIQALDAGHRRGAFRGKGIVVPTLDAVLRAVPPETLLSIELKSPGAEEALSAALRASGRLARVLVGAADTDSAERLRKLLPEATHYFPAASARCLVATAKVGAGEGACDPYDVLAAPPSAAGVDLATPGMIGALHARGIPVLFFTVDEEAEMERLFRAGADGIFTDHPTRARRVLDRLRR